MPKGGTLGGTPPEPPVAALARDAIMRGLELLATPSTAVSALRWLERAHRLAPLDPNVTLTLASACLAHDPTRAAALFQSVADKHDVRQAWLGLAAARLRLSEPDAAADALAALLSRHAFTPDAAALAEAIGGHHGWCALRSGGRLEIHPAAQVNPRHDAGVRIIPDGKPLRGTTLAGSEDARAIDVRIALDGKPLRGTTLPAHWERARAIDVRIGDRPLLGSPIQIAAIRRLAGCVEVCDGGIRGWAWHPGDPDTPPALTLLDPSGRLLHRFAATDESIAVPDTGPLSRPHSFELTRADLPDAPGPLHVIGPDGKDLTGSPLDPFADETAHVTAAMRLQQIYPAGPPPKIRRPAAWPGSPRPPNPVSWPGLARPPTTCPRLDQKDLEEAVIAGRRLGSAVLRADAPVPIQPVGADAHRRAITIVIPVHNGGTAVLACLASVLASKPPAARILVVDDGSSDRAVIAALDALARQRRIALLRHPRALGFPAAANAGVRTARGRDVVLLNSDTLVPRRWLERLHEAAYASRDIGTVTPLSNDASILSYPNAAGTNPRPDQASTTRLDRAAQRANGGAITDIPVGVGFCLYLRRDCLNAVGSFRADRFAQGYGEENDFCLRARRLGWRNVALTGLFVGHLGGTSFGGSAAHLRARNSRIVEQLHPGYHTLIEDYLARDPLADPRRRIDLHRWRERSRKQSAILITHNDGGGVEQRLLHAIAVHDHAGRRPIVLRPAETAEGEPAIAVRDGAAGDCPNMVFAMPRELPALLRLLRAAKPEIIEAHHFAAYPPAIYDLVTSLDTPYDVHVHDYAWFCPRVSLLGGHDRYCGEPDLPGCESCVTDNGHFLQENTTVAALRHRSAAFLAGARHVIVPSDDTGIRMRRHFDGLATITVPHEDDTALPPHTEPPPATRPARVCVVGAIGVHKGYDILLACARDAARRNLDLDFIVVGHTIDDARLLATGRVFVTGRFEPGEAVRLIASQNARLGFVASICPETWCLSLGDIWRAGLRSAAFDIGAPAERIRSTGRGILLPLGLSASAINNALIAAMRTV